MKMKYDADPYNSMTDNPNCAITAKTDLSRVTVVQLDPPSPCCDYLDAMKQANDEANHRLGENMLLSWYDRDRDFESPQHSSECHARSAVPGYVDYGLSYGATLMVDIEEGGRFVFFYLPVDLS
jgi:hypothetical protein